MKTNMKRRRQVPERTELEQRVDSLVEASDNGLLPSQVVQELAPTESPAAVRQAIRHLVQDGHIRFDFDARMVAAD